MSPSVYAVFWSMTIIDECRGMNMFDGDCTASFAPEELSTYDQISSSLSAFDYAGINCPSGLTQPHAPIVSPPPSFLTRLNLLIGHKCDEWAEAGNWTDPIMTLSSSTGLITGPTLPSVPIGAQPDGPPDAIRLRRDPANAHETLWASASTTMPS